MSNPIGEELERRQSNTDAVMAFFRAHPQEWIPAVDLEQVGGRQAWRSRVSDARKRFQAADEGTILNRLQRANRAEREGGLPARMCLGPVYSEYMFRPKPLGRRAETRVPQKRLF